MAYVKTSNGQVAQYPYSIGAFRRDNLNTSFPSRISDATLATFGVFPVAMQNPPAVDEKTHTAVQDAAPKQVGGVWILGWSVVEKTAEEQERYRKLQADAVRRERNALLAATDWMALSDVTLSPDWATYRQQLRDITNQAGFPFDVVFPVKPSA